MRMRERELCQRTREDGDEKQLLQEEVLLFMHAHVCECIHDSNIYARVAPGAQTGSSHVEEIKGGR